MKFLKDLIKHYKNDIPSGIVVFFVALPLCLAIAQVSTGRPDLVFSGIIAGIIGGVVIGFLSGSSLGVSGPAAGLVVIVFSGIQELSPGGDTLAGFRAMLLATFIAGIIQLIAGYLKAGIIGNYFPSSVIKGMLAAIGITIILKEIPHILGYDKDFMGDESFEQKDGHNTFTEIYYAIKYYSPAALVISVVSIIMLVVSDMKPLKNLKVFKFVPAAFFVVIAGVIINLLMPADIRLNGEHLVSLPVANTASDFFSFFTLPDFSSWTNPAVYKIAFTIAIIASIETLLSLEATDKLDPLKRKSSGNRELKAQGVGNMISGLIGGLPITQVIVRSSANINSGGKTRFASVVHGLVLLLSAIFIPYFINFIPLATLAAILVLVGYKLAKVSLFKSMYKMGWDQFIPFIVTVAAILSTDLLKGIMIGMIPAFFYIFRSAYRHAYESFREDKEKGELIRLELSDQVTFLNKGVILQALNEVPENSNLLIDGSRSKFIDPDVLELLHEFEKHGSKPRRIEVKLKNIPEPENTVGAH